MLRRYLRGGCSAPWSLQRKAMHQAPCTSPENKVGCSGWRELGVTKLPPSPTLPSQNPALPRRGFSFFVELKGMPDYWVFQDKLFKRACIHRSNCSVRKGAISPGRLEGTWHGAYTTYEEARRTAAELSPNKGAQLNCRLCHPQNF
jgi:hypothetical protein